MDRVRHPTIGADGQAAASLEGGADVVELQNRVVCRDGSLRWVEWKHARRAGGRPFLCRGPRRDREPPRRRGAGALRRVATLVARETAPDAVFAAVVREVGGVLGVEAAHMGRYDSDHAVVSVASGAYPAIPVGARFPLEGDSVSARVLRTGRPARMDGYEGASGAIADDQGDRDSVRDRRPDLRRRATVGRDDRHLESAKPFPAESESRLQHFTELVATALANAATRAELKASRARIVAAADELADGSSETCMTESSSGSSRSGSNCAPSRPRFRLSMRSESSSLR